MAVQVLEALSRAPGEGPSGARLVLNVPNRGATPCFDAETVIEARRELSPRGASCLPAPDVPDAARPLLARLEAYQRQSAAAIRSGVARGLVRALAANPLISGEGVADRLLRAAAGTIAIGGWGSTFSHE